MTEVYVGYEENNHEIAIEDGPVNEITVFDNEAKATEWFIERAKSGIDEGFILDTEDEKTYNDNTLCDSETLKKEILSGWCSMVMFRTYQENWDASYTICVERKEVL